MEEHLQSFCISGGQDDQGKFSFRSTKNTFIAKALGTKAEMLNSDEVVHNLPVADTVAFELQTTNASRDWSIETGKETRCGLLSTFSRTATDVPELIMAKRFGSATGRKSPSLQKGRALEAAMARGSGSLLRSATTQDPSCSTSQSKQL